MAHIVAAVFDDRRRAEEGADALRRHGAREEDLRVLDRSEDLQPNGMPAAELRPYEEALRRSEVVLTVRATPQTSANAVELMERQRAHHIRVFPEGVSQGTQRAVEVAPWAESGRRSELEQPIRDLGLEEELRRDHQDRFASRGFEYDETRFAYGLGARLALERSGDWQDVMSDAHRDWEELRQGTWNDYKLAIEHGFHAARAKTGAARP